MSNYDIALEPLVEDFEKEEEKKRQEEEAENATKEMLIKMLSYGNETTSYLDDILTGLENHDEKSPATEGIFGSIWDFVTTMVRTAIKFVTNTANWLTAKIKSIVNFRKRQKRYRDKKFETLTAIYNGLTADRRQKANERFAKYKIDYTPSFETYRKMCLAFGTVIKIMDDQINVYVTRDVAIFGAESSNTKTIPSWVTGLYDETTSREALLLMGIKYEDNQFIYKSPFTTLPSMTLGDLGYVNLSTIRLCNSDYQSNCWRNIVAVSSLRQRFLKCEEQLRTRYRELKRDIAKVDRKDITKATKNVIQSSTLAGRLASYLLTTDEALDVRRGWLIDAGLRACGDGVSHAE